jgi:hypothetical protein
MTPYDPPPAAPPRLTGWRRVLFRAFVVAVAVVAVTFAWDSWRARRDWADAEAAVAETDQTDPGWRLPELEAKRDNPPADENGALEVLAVAKALPGADATKAADEAIGDPPPEVRLNEEHAKTLQAVLDPIIPAVIRARSLDRYTSGRYPVQWQPDIVSTVLPATEARKVAYWLRADAIAKADAGDMAIALENWRAIIHVARTIGDEPASISQLVRISVRATAVGTLERLLAQGEPPAGGLHAVQMELETEDREPIELTVVRGERALFDQSSTNLFDSMTWFQRLAIARSKATSPGTTRAVGLRYLTHLAECMKEPEAGRPILLAKLKEKFAEQPTLVALMTQAVDKVLDTARRSHAQLRCATVAVAAERFRRDNGRWPTTIDELVTAKLLTAVPADPYDGKPLRLKKLPDGLVIYSVGPDGADNGGTLDRQKPTRPGSDIGFRLWDVSARRRSAP